MLDGILNLPIWAMIVIVLTFTHITSIGVTVYLHRTQAHRALDMHPALSHFFRFWMWLTTGQVTKEWVAVHRKHHAKCETEEDPHSPQRLGLHRVLWGGALLYRKEAAKQDTLDTYGHATPNDWIERHLYTPHNGLGILLMLAIDLLLFGVYGLVAWGVQMVWVPFWAAGVINGVGHYYGYRNFECQDHATNIVPVGLIMGGEELHNNHHAFPSSARFSIRRFEFDLGWMYIRLFEALGLAKVKKLAPHPVVDRNRRQLDVETVQAVITNRMHVLSDYARKVIVPVWRKETERAETLGDPHVRKLLIRETRLLDDLSIARLKGVLRQSPSLQTVYHFRERLKGIWESRGASHDHLVEQLRDWCANAEQTGEEALREFAATIRSYTLPPGPKPVTR